MINIPELLAPAEGIYKKELSDRKNKKFLFIENKFENKSIIVAKMTNVENSISKNIVEKNVKNYEYI